jgi:hypothetical protein
MVITVNELIETLQLILDENPDNGDLVIILQGDAEGNSYSPLAGVELAYYEEESTYSGQVHSADEMDEGVISEDANECVVLWPTN